MISAIEILYLFHVVCNFLFLGDNNIYIYIITYFHFLFILRYIPVADITRKINATIVIDTLPTQTHKYTHIHTLHSITFYPSEYFTPV